MLRINALITTLAMAFIVGGCASLVTKGTLIVLFDEPGFGKFAQTEFLDVKTSIWIMVVAVIVFGLLLARTTAGRYMYAAGGNAEAARLAGVRVDAVRILAFTLSGAAAGSPESSTRHAFSARRPERPTRRLRSRSSPASSSAERAFWAERAPSGAPWWECSSSH